MKDKARYQNLVGIVLGSLNERTKNILEKRFGLSGRKKETLEKIGKDFGITRERVRQIIADSFRRLAKSKDAVEMKEFSAEIIFTLEKRGGIISQEEIISDLAGEDSKERNALGFLVKCSKEIEETEVEGLIVPSWSLSGIPLEKIKEVEKKSLEFLSRENKAVSLEKLAASLEKEPKDSKFDLSEINNYIQVLSKVRSNSFGKWGISDWPEISPKNTRDKIYLVLKENKKPLHFRDIAKKIDEYGLSRKKAHPQTVHNELIKDKRFVLIGRGIYAIAEWGYSEGTVRDILKGILEKNGPLPKEEIFKEVFKQRKVKKATVMINLNNGKFFSQSGDVYSLKK